MPRTLVILAAGMGRRFGGLKQIEPVGPHGEAIVDYSVFDAVHAGFDRVVCVTRRRIEAEFEQAFGRRLRKHVALTYAHQEFDTAAGGHAAPADRNKPWGTGHAVLVGGMAAEGAFAVANADDFYGAESFAVLGAHLDGGTGHGGGQHRRAEHALVGFPLERTLSESGAVSRGVCRCSADGALIAVTERTHIERGRGAISFREADGSREALDPATTVSMNLWGFQASIIPQLQERFAEFLRTSGSTLDTEFRLPDAINTLIAAGRAAVRVLPTRASWCGITYAEDLPRVRAVIRQCVERGEYPSPLWS